MPRCFAALRVCVFVPARIALTIGPVNRIGFSATIIPPMRETRTASEIRDEVDRLLNANRRVPITVPLPTKLSMPSDPFEHYEANWAIPSHSSFAADREAVRKAILATKARFDME